MKILALLKILKGSVQMKKGTSKLMIAGLLSISMFGTTVSASKPGVAYNATTWYQHGSSVQVSESQLKTSIPTGYDVNESTQASAKKGEYEKLFAEDCVQDLNITISENNWNYLLQHANKEPYVMADRVSIGNQSVDYVGLKTKGSYSLLTAWQSDTDRFSFAVNVGKYVKKDNGYSDTQNFFGMKKFSLNNVTGDATYLKEYLSYKMFRELGIPAPYCSLVKLNINGKYWGVYSLIENIDTPMYKRATTFSDVDFYKPENTGGSLVYNSKFDPYLNGSANLDLSTYDQNGNVLASYTGLWDHQETGTTIEDYQDAVAKGDPEKIQKKDKEVKENIIEMMTWMKKLGQLNNTSNANTTSYETTAEEILDVDAVLKYFAANTFIAMLDGYQANEAHNFAIGIHDGKVFAVPWDYNYSFGAFNLYNTSDYINFNIDKPVTRVNMSERPLLNVLLKNDKFRAKYEQYLLDCCKMACMGGTVSGTDLAGKAYSRTYAPNYFKSIIDSFKSGDLGAALRENPVETPFYTYDQYVKTCDPFAALIQLRATAVQNQVNDNFTRVSDYGIVLSTFGFSQSWGFGNNQTWTFPADWKFPEGSIVTPSPSPSVRPTYTPSPSPSLRPSPSPSVKPSPSPSVSPSVKPSAKPSANPSTGTAAVKVQLSNQTSTSTNTIGGSISLTTLNGTAFDLSKLKVKYYFTADSNSKQNVWIDSAAMQCNRAPWYSALTSGTSASVETITGNSNADRCMTIGFTSTESLTSDATFTINFRMANDNWSNFDQSNDYSYGESENVVILYDGKVIAGNSIE